MPDPTAKNQRGPLVNKSSPPPLGGCPNCGVHGGEVHNPISFVKGCVLRAGPFWYVRRWRSMARGDSARGNLWLAKELWELGAVQFGEFNVGRTLRSPIYLNPRLLVS